MKVFERVSFELNFTSEIITAKLLESKSSCQKQINVNFRNEDNRPVTLGYVQYRA